MPTEYELNHELQTIVDGLLREPEFEPVSSNNIKVTACLKIKMDDDGNFIDCHGDAASLKRVTPPFTVLIESHFMLVVDAGVWRNEPSQCEAAIHKALMRIKLKTTESGEVKIGTRPPDVQEFTETLLRYGPYNRTLRAMVIAAQHLDEVVDVVQETADSREDPELAVA